MRETRLNTCVLILRGFIPPFREWRATHSILAVIGFGLFWGAYVLGPRPLNLFDTEWLWGDLAQVFLAWTQYGLDPSPHWLLTNRLSYPLDISVALFDPMPLPLLLLTPIGRVLPEHVQFFGVYFLACVVAQGVFGYLASREMLRCTGRPGSSRAREFITMSTGALCAMAPFTLMRFTGHTALSSQWLLVMSIWVALRWRNSSYSKWLFTNGATMLLATGFNPYLAFMVALTLAAVALSSIGRVRLLAIGVRIASLAVIALCGLYLFGFMSGAETGAGGYGVYSMNMLGPLDSNAKANLFRLDISDPTGGQTFEGYEYQGLGALLLIAIAAVLTASKRGLPRVVLAGVAVVFCAYVLAVSFTVSFAGSVYELPLPSPIADLLSRFRASGRFFWIGSFWLLIIAAGLVARSFSPKIAALIVMSASLIQLVDVAGVASDIRGNLRSAQKLAPILEPDPHLAARYKSVVVLPAWQCDNQGTPGGVRNYESIGYFAALSRLPTNNFYAARTPANQAAFHCNPEQYGSLLKNEHMFVVSTEYMRSSNGAFDNMNCLALPITPAGQLCVSADGADADTLLASIADGATGASYADRWQQAVDYPRDRIVYDYFCSNGLGRECSQDDLRYVEDHVGANPNLAQLANAIVFRHAEIALGPRQLSDEEFVAAVYLVVLGRAADAPGMKAQLEQLKLVANKEAFIGSSFITSPEFRQRAPRR